MALQDFCTFEWNKQYSIFFIELLKNHPCLWQTKSSEYRNKDLKVFATKTISAELSNKSNCVVNDDDVMKKLHTLRSQFRKETKLLQASMKTGTDDVYTPKLWCFYLLKFLDEDNIIHESNCNLDGKECDQNTEIVCADAMVQRDFSSFEWNKKYTILFIELLERHPCVWKNKSEEFFNKNLKAFALKSICAELSSKTNCVVKTNDVMKKLHTLRSQFRKENKLLKASVTLGAGAEDVYSPKLWCFNSLKFLDEGDIINESNCSLDGMECDQSISHTIEGSETLDSIEPTSADNDLMNASISSSPNNATHLDSSVTTCDLSTNSVSTASENPKITTCAPTTPSRQHIFSPLLTSEKAIRKRKYSDIDDLLSIAMEKIEKLQSPDPDYDFARVIANELKQMSTTQKKITKKLIFDAIHIGSMGFLTMDHHIRYNKDA